MHLSQDIGIQYYGMECEDSDHFDMMPYLTPAADYIHRALTLDKGKS